MPTAGPGLLVINRQAGAISEETEGRLRSLLPELELAVIEEGEDLAALLESRLGEPATVVVAGGDGTVAAAARALAGTPHRLGIVPLGTFNNFARALGLPLEPEAAAAAVTSGRQGSVTLGRINGRPFIEAAFVGVFGDLIQLGEAAKELRYGELLNRVRNLSSLEFDYRLSGELEVAGRAAGLVAANTPSTGARIPLGEVTPEQPLLELSIFSALPPRRAEPPRSLFRRVRIATEPVVNVYADAEDVGQTPAEIEIDVGGLNVILPP